MTFDYDTTIFIVSGIVSLLLAAFMLWWFCLKDSEDSGKVIQGFLSQIFTELS